MSDRGYQNKLNEDIDRAWASGHRNVIAVMPTGAGKTYTAVEKIRSVNLPTVVIAHRQELVGQWSLALAKQGVEHNLITPKPVSKWIMGEHLRQYGKNWTHYNSMVTVVGVDTLLARKKKYASWLQTIGFWVTDEAHHLLRKNKWGKAVESMPGASGLGLTATPCRADGAGLGRHADGVMDTIVEGPTMRDLIRQRFLTDYRVFGVPSDVEYDAVNVGSTGDYVQQQLRDAVRDSHLVGDIVEHYLRIAPGQRGVTFTVDVDSAVEVANQFNARGVPAMAVSAKTPDAQRADAVKRLANGELLQLVNCDLFGEGFDLPAVSVVSMARRTLSFGLFCQQFGRALRPAPGKTEAIIIDHAGNVGIHGLPDAPRDWTLDRRAGTPRTQNVDDEIPLRYCVNCTQPFSRTNKTCPYCGHYEPPSRRDAPEHVDGDLTELDPITLAAMRQELDAAAESPQSVMDRMRYAGAPEVAIRSAGRRIHEKQCMQAALRESIAWYAHLKTSQGMDYSQIYRAFHHTFGTDVMNAQLLGRPEASALADRINAYLGGAT